MSNTQNNIPQSININGKQYFSTEDLNNFDTPYFNGTHRNLRGIIKKKNIPESVIAYAYIKDNKLIKSNESYVRAKLYLESSWVYKNIPKMINEYNKTLSNQTIQTVQTKPVSSQNVQPIVSKSKVTTNKTKTVVKTSNKPISEPKPEPIPEIETEIVKELNDYVEEAPNILQLTNEEMFKDTNGNCINIEVRGEREHNKCYFKVKDVSIGFNMPNLLTTLVAKNACYEMEIHYKYFTNKILFNVQKNVSKKELYLTYNGMLKVLFTSRTGNAELFQNWATETLFIHQMGSTEQKQTLATSLLGVNIQTIKQVFNSASNKTPTVYLFYIGKAKKLINDNYNDDDILCKFGCTDDIARRTTEHNRTYKKLYNLDSDIELLMYSIIDPQYIFDAENNIRGYFRNNKINNDDKTELIVINKNNMDQIKQHYKMMQNSYIGRYEEMNKRIVELEKEILIKDHQIAIKEQELKLKDKDIELANVKLNQVEQRMEIAELKLQLLKFERSDNTNLNF